MIAGHSVNSTGQFIKSMKYKRYNLFTNIVLLLLCL